MVTQVSDREASGTTESDELKEDLMGYTDKASNEAEQMKGKAKEWVGDKTDDENLQAEGAADRASGGVKQAGEHLKDAARDARDALR